MISHPVIILSNSMSQGIIEAIRERKFKGKVTGKDIQSIECSANKVHLVCSCAGSLTTHYHLLNKG